MTRKRRTELTAPAIFALSLLCLITALWPPHMDSAVVAQHDGAPALHELTGTRRVVILAPVLRNYAAVTGGLSHVAALSKFTEMTAMFSDFAPVFPQAGSLALAGDGGAQADPELLLQRRADLVITWQYYDDAPRMIGTPHILELQIRPPQADADLAQIFRALGYATGNETTARRLWAAAAADRAFIQNAAMQARAGTRPPRVSLTAVSPTGSIWTAGGGFFISDILRDVGGISAASGAVPTRNNADPELDLVLDPDIILVPAHRLGDTLGDPDRMPLWWQSLRAVRAHRVYLMPYVDNLDIPVGRSLIRFWLAEVLNPRLPRRTRNAYRAIIHRAYRRCLTDAELDGMLYVSANRDAAGYTRFTRDDAQHGCANVASRTDDTVPPLLR